MFATEQNLVLDLRRGNLLVMKNNVSIDEVIRIEDQFSDPLFRKNLEAMRALLHPDFLEITFRGKILDSADLMEALSVETEGPPLVAFDYEGVMLAHDVVLLTYKTEYDGTHYFRTSIWMKLPHDRWVIRLHQFNALPATPNK